MKKKNIIKATTLPFISSSLALSKNQVLTPVDPITMPRGIMYYISKGEFLNAMQRCDSVGYWNESPHGGDWWNHVRNKFERGYYGRF